MSKGVGRRQEKLLADHLKREAKNSRPAFSAALHLRIVQAIRHSESCSPQRRLASEASGRFELSAATSQQPPDLLGRRRWTYAAMAAICAMGALLAAWRLADSSDSSSGQPALAIAVQPADHRLHGEAAASAASGGEASVSGASDVSGSRVCRRETWGSRESAEAASPRRRAPKSSLGNLTIASADRGEQIGSTAPPQPTLNPEVDLDIGGDAMEQIVRLVELELATHPWAGLDADALAAAQWLLDPLPWETALMD